jgi:acyl-CoA thioester hydrolase
MMKIVYDYEMIVPKSAIDANDHVNNVFYIQWMQDAATAHSTYLGFTPEFYEVSEGTWVARSHYIEYLKPSFLGDEIVIQTWISSIKRSISNREYAFFRKSDKALLAKAKTVWIYINIKSGRPIAIPKELLEKYVASEAHEPKIIA